MGNAGELISKDGPACDLPAGRLSERLGELAQGLLARALDVRKTAEGYALGFSDDDSAIDAEIDAFIAVEADCCSFLECTVRRDPAAGRIWLELTGPAGTRAWLDGMAERIADTQPKPPGRSGCCCG